MTIFHRIFEYFARWFRRDFRTARENVALRSSERIAPKPDGRILSRHDKRIKWCAEFNARNGNVVSAKSPISIYFATHKGR